MAGPWVPENSGGA